jgi:hypothetical protein
MTARLPRVRTVFALIDGDRGRKNFLYILKAGPAGGSTPSRSAPDPGWLLPYDH